MVAVVLVEDAKDATIASSLQPVVVEYDWGGVGVPCLRCVRCNGVADGGGTIGGAEFPGRNGNHKRCDGVVAGTGEVAAAAAAAAWVRCRRENAIFTGGIC